MALPLYRLPERPFRTLPGGILRNSFADSVGGPVTLCTDKGAGEHNPSSEGMYQEELLAYSL